MNALAGQGIEISSERGDKGLAFTSLHFGNFAVIQHHAADHLDIKVAHVEDAP